jgi:hypothetical protein
MSRRKPVSRFRFLVPASFGLLLFAVASVSETVARAGCDIVPAAKCAGSVPTEFMWLLFAGMLGAFSYAGYRAYRDFVRRDYQAENMQDGHW